MITGTLLLHAGQIASLIMLLIFGAMLFSTFQTASEITQSFSNYLITSSLHPYVVMLIVLFFYWAMGTFMDPWALLIVSLPIFFPIVTKLGFDPVWFGIVVTIDVEMGMITPPFGLNLFILKASLKDTSMDDMVKGSLPFVLLLMLGLAIVMMFPSLATWLPGRMGM